LHGLWLDSNKRPDKNYLPQRDYYNALMKLKFHSRRESSTGNHSWYFRVTLQYGSLYNDLIAIESISGFERNLIKDQSRFYGVSPWEGQKTGRNFCDSTWIKPLSEYQKNITLGWGLHFSGEVAISEQKFNQHLKVLADRINFPGRAF